MTFRHLVDEELKKISRFKGARCGKGYEDIERNLIGYEIDNLFAGADGHDVKAGIISPDGMIDGVFYEVEDRLYSVGLIHPTFLNEILTVVGMLGESLNDNLDVGNRSWLYRRFEKASVPLLQSQEALVHKNMGGRMTVLRPVLVDFGFDSIFADLTFGYGEEKYFAALIERKGDLVKPLYEAYFDTMQEGNGLYRDVKRDSFISKKGNKIHKLCEQKFTKYFHKVDGEWFLCR